MTREEHFRAITIVGTEKRYKRHGLLLLCSGPDCAGAGMFADGLSVGAVVTAASAHIDEAVGALRCPDRYQTYHEVGSRPEHCLTCFEVGEPDTAPNNSIDSKGDSNGPERVEQGSAGSAGPGGPGRAAPAGHGERRAERRQGHDSANQGEVAAHAHACVSCSPDGVLPGSGCINCRQTGMDQTPCQAEGHLPQCPHGCCGGPRKPEAGPDPNHACAAHDDAHLGRPCPGDDWVPTTTAPSLASEADRG